MKKTLKFISIILALVTAFSSFAVISSAETAVDASNWMSAVSSDLKLSEMSIPGTHDSATQYLLGSIVARCQKLSIRSQLYAGVRFLDIRLEKHDGGYKLVHSILDCKTGNGLLTSDLEIEQVLSECYDFLDKNPGETIIMCVKEDDEDAGTAFVDDFYKNYIIPDTAKWYTLNVIPTLGDVRGKIVFARRNSTTLNADTTGIDLSGWRDQGDQQTVPNTFSISQNEKATIQDRYELDPDMKWEAVKNMLEMNLDKNNLNLNFLSSAYKMLPVYNASFLNTRFSDYEFKSDYAGIVIFDFVTPELCQKVYSLNLLSQPTEEPVDAARDKFRPGLFFITVTVFDFICEIVCRVIVSASDFFNGI